MLIEFHGIRKTYLQKFFAILNDPFYYALRLPSVGHVMFYATIFMLIISALMMLIWLIIRKICLGGWPDLAETPPKFFPALAMVALFTLCAGVINRRLTSEKIRGKFISFSPKCWIENDCVFFQVVDKRSTQLIGTTIVVDVMYTEHNRRQKNLPSKLICRTLFLKSPGILVIPTDIGVPISDIFDSKLECLTCGKTDFVCIQALHAHMQFLHSHTKISVKSLEARLTSLLQFRVRIRGVDEVSGKGGMVEKSYDIDDIVVTPIDEEETFSLIDDASPSKYIHVDFKYT